MNKKVILCLALLCALKTLAQTARDSTYTETVFIIDEVPSNTPHDASLYLATDLDGWLPDLEKRKFERTSDGKYQLKIQHSKQVIGFKITRGSWDAVEARENGRALPNRSVKVTQNLHEVHIVVEVWEDISIGSYTIYMFFLLIMAIQGFLLIVAINTIRNKNKVANTVLSLLLLLITISLLGRASTFDPDIFTWQPKLIFIPELVLFTYGPIFYLYIHKLLLVDGRKRFWPHFIPALIHILIYIPWLTLENQTLIYRLIDKELFPYFAITGCIALLFNTAYWIASKRLIQQYAGEGNLTNMQKKYIGFLNWVLGFKAVYLFLWLLLVVIYLAGKALGRDWLFISENLIDVLWLLFSLIIFALAYYAVKYPELLREKKKYQDNKLNGEEVNHIKNRLIDLLEKETIYLKPDLTLENMAHMIPTASHTLSRVINESFDQSFTELVNSYRIDEFIKRTKTNRDSSFLEMALAVGFSSKPTFNRAFKKHKGCTPREYFQND